MMRKLNIIIDDISEVVINVFGIIVGTAFIGLFIYIIVLFFKECVF